MQEKLLYTALFIIIALMLTIPALAGLSTAQPGITPDTQPMQSERTESATPPSREDTRESPESEAEPETDSSAPPDSERPSEAEQTAVSVYFPKENTAHALPLEEYVRGVVMAEMPATFASEALKAQAVAARTYCMYHLMHGERHAGTEARICTDYTHCMAYLSDSDAAERWGEDAASEIIAAIRSAVEETAGEYLTYDGSVICALFHSGSHQMTESAENVWGNPIPYLVSVPTPEESATEEVSFTAEEWRKLFADYGTVNYTALLFQSGDAVEIAAEKDSAGRIRTICSFGREMSGTTLRTAARLRSTSCEFTLTDAGVTVVTRGSGHGVGMSQYGADAMAKQGADFASILLHYYPGAALVAPD